MRILFVIYLLVLTGISVQGQGVAIGEWEAHLPYQRGTSLTQSPDRIIYSTPLSIFSILKEDQSIEFISKVEGLTDVGIELVEHDPFNNQVFVFYTNSNIDVINGASVINIPNIFLNTTISGDKGVRNIFFESVSNAFMATGFGIVSYDPQAYTFGTTILTGVGVNQIISRGDLLLAATDDGIYTINRKASPILADFSQWSLLGRSNGLPSLYSSSHLVVHNDRIYASIDDVLYSSSDLGNEWTIVHEEPDLRISFISPTDDRLIVGWTGEGFEKEVLFFDNDDAFIKQNNQCSGVPLDAIRDESGNIWYADLFNNIRMSEGYSSPCSQFNYNSPFSENVSDIVVNDAEEVLIASGGVAENFTYLFSRDGFYLQTDKNWQNFNEFENNNIEAFDLLSVFRVAFHPSSSKIYAGSYWAGLLEFDRESQEYVLFNQSNSTLRGAIGDPARERITGLAFDTDENLWVATYNAPEPINVLTNEGDWISIPVPFNGTLSDVIIDDLGYKWFSVEGNNGGVLVYDSGNSIQNLSDDRFRFINGTNGELTTNRVLTLNVDLEGEVWVGSSEGPVIFDCGSDALDSDRCPGIRRKVLQDSIAAFLLADQEIRVIEFDGANRKWIGTRNGLFVQSEQGDEQIEHFTADNSPLFDNEINALAYEGIKGVMWIGTNKGVLSFRTESTDGANIHLKSEVYAFPNPVYPEYSGPIAIKGLVEEANIKITDINGRLVKEMDALGGQAIWDRTDQRGRLVASGVYLIFSADQNAFDRPDSFVTKIMILN